MSIKVTELTHIYTPGTPFEHIAVDHVSFEIKDGEFVGLIGHTGSGKSTLIQLISGLVRPTSGSVIIDGLDILDKKTERKELRRRVGVVFQYPEHQLFEETVAQDIAFGPTKQGLDQEAAALRVKKAMDLVGLDYNTYASKSPFDLSGGQKRKVAIAGVLATKPSTLILDEPIAGLDPVGRDDFMELIKKLNESGKTILMISHNMEGLAEYAGRVIAMCKGKIVLDGTPTEVFADAKVLRQYSLDQPEAARMAELLRSRGIPLPAGLIREGELANALAEVLI